MLLFLDDADYLFGKRGSEVHNSLVVFLDRLFCRNSEVRVLLTGEEHLLEEDTNVVLQNTCERVRGYMLVRVFPLLARRYQPGEEPPCPPLTVNFPSILFPVYFDSIAYLRVNTRSTVIYALDRPVPP